MPDVTVIILTYNEQLHLRRAIESVRSFASHVLVVDSFSTDATAQIAEACGATLVAHPFVNQAEQFNWALDHCAISTPWVFRLDADEWVTPELAEEIKRRLDALPETVWAVRCPRRMHFMGRWMRFGGVGERRMLRLFRAGRGRCEQKWMDEHIVMDGGACVDFSGPLIDDNLNSLTWWTQKHNRYASREAVERLIARREAGGSTAQTQRLSGQARRVRWLKKHVYYRTPPILRALMLYGVRYIVLLGFLDGKPGLIFHFLQGCWYRALVDAKVYSVQHAMRRDGLTFEQAVQSHLQIDLTDESDAADAGGS
ncbi:MAG: glycosyltransferase family 2 protein [Phycisphaerales bacterium JB063]